MTNSVRRGLLPFLITLAFASSAGATPIVAGTDIHVFNGPGNTGGGEFTIVVDDTTSFISFCLQQTEYINFVNDFNVDAISTYAVSDPSSRGGDGFGRDYLSPHTAFLYTQFRQGTLSGYNYSGLNRANSADQLQNAIWMFEQEIAMLSSNPFVALANSAIALGKWSGLGDVRVLNLSLNGVEAQDQLCCYLRARSLPCPSLRHSFYLEAAFRSQPECAADSAQSSRST